MTPDRRLLALELLTTALDSTPRSRPRVLDELCRDDDTLRQEVESLLAFEGEVEKFLPDPALVFPEEPPAEFESGRRIGPYRVVELIGRGGMGSIYRAVREDDFEKEVAIKLVRHGLPSAGMARRFHAERQILARLEHPSIARLLDGGTTTEGSPYLVMDLVDGVAVDRYCEICRLGVTERLELFRQIADAVAYAHQSLVIHRDLKPGNVLVTAAGVPKLLDFGIAKLLDGELGSSDTVTHSGGAMTLRYASPEQVLGEPVTALSDVYSLGVLLYELLTGELPCDLGTCDFQEIPRRILSEDPRRPSQTMARSPGGPGAWRRQLAGDVDAIALKALHKEPRHRYASAEQLADDIRRHLEGHPVRARQGTWVYRAGKLVRRQRWGVAAVLLVLGLSVVSSVQWRRAERERERAEQEHLRAEGERTEAIRERVRAERVSSFMQELFQSAAPDAARGRTVTVREILDRGRAELAAGLADEPEIKSALTGTLGDVYRDLGLYNEALELMSESALLLRRRYPEGHEDLVLALNDVAGVFYYLGRWRDAEERFREVLAMRVHLGQEPVQIARALSNLASALKQQGRYNEAGALYGEALEIREEHLGAGHPDVATSLYSLGSLHYEQGEMRRAEALLQRALAIRIGTLGGRHTRVATIHNTLGRVLLAAGDLVEAEALQRRALAIREELLGAGHAGVALTRKDLAEVLLERGEKAAAGELLTRSLSVLRASSRPAWEVAGAESVYGAYLTLAGRFREAEPLVVSGLARIRQARGEASIRTRRARARAVALYEAWGKPERAAAYRAGQE